MTLPNSHVFVTTKMCLKEGKIQKWLEESIHLEKPIYSVIMTPVDIPPTANLMHRLQNLGDHYVNRDYLTATECARIFADAERVVTARYHGMVFARAVGTPDIVTVDPRYKSATEVIPTYCEDAMGHIHKLKGAL